MIDLSEVDDRTKEEITEWFAGLDPLQQRIVEPLFKTLSDLLNGIEDTIVAYRFDKSLANPWSMAIGAQYQINKRWQARGEVNFLGSRTQALASLNYRFGIKGDNVLSGKRKARKEAQALEDRKVIEFWNEHQ